MHAVGHLVDPQGPHGALDAGKLRTWSELRGVIQTHVAPVDYQLSENGFAAWLARGAQRIGGSGGSLEPPGPLS